jgi:DNA polymerase-3 subunit gamma/tau
MSQYIVSARKYRPDSFGTLIGQDNIAQTLKNSILRGQLAHAYLFCGPRGVGKTTTARIFAKMINCSNPSEDMEPCGTCESCLSFAEGRSYCIHELDAASNNGVEDIKTLMDQVRIPPQVGRYSVYIIDEVHMLSQAAFNAFLKTLEEPPAHAIFILATTEKHKILPTILSRCQTYDFNRITIENIVRNLRMVASSENITIDDESLHVIAHKADGAMRDALTIFDQTVAFCGTDVKYQDVLRNLNVLDYEYSFSLVDAFLKGDYPTALLAFDEILTKGFNALHFIAALSSHLRDLIVSKSGGLEALLELPDSLKARYKEQADRCTLPFLYEALNITTTCESGYRASVNPRLHIEFAMMRLSFILTRMQAPAAQPAAPVLQPASVVAQPAQTAQPAPTPVQPAHPAPAPVTASASADVAPAQPQRRERAARPGAVAASAKSLVEKEEEVKNEVDTGAAPSEELLKAKWPELAKEYASKPRMASMLSTTTLRIEGDDTKRIVTFMVDNEAQKDWVESKLLHDLEGKYQRIVGSPRVALRVDVIPHEEVKPVVYMPEDKAKELMAENDEVKSLVKDLGLDTK